VDQCCPFDRLRAGLEIEARSTSLHRTQDGVEIHPAGCDFGNTEGDYPVRFIFFRRRTGLYTRGNRLARKKGWKLNENDGACWRQGIVKQDSERLSLPNVR